MNASILITRSDGKTFAFNRAPFGLTSITGVDAPSIEVFTQKMAVADGDIVTGSRVSSRLITIKAKSCTNKQASAQRINASSFFRPKYSYDVQINYGDTTRFARNCILKGFAMPTGNLYHHVAVTISFLCPSGYLSGGGIFGKNINGVTGGFGFPFVSLKNTGFCFSVRNFKKMIDIDNTGDAPSHIRAIFEVTGEDTVENPTLFCGTNKVRVITTLTKGDMLEIDTEKRTVRLNGANCLRLISKDSTISGISLAIGINSIGFEADSHENQLSVRVYYEHRYNGM